MNWLSFCNTYSRFKPVWVLDLSKIEGPLKWRIYSLPWENQIRACPIYVLSTSTLMKWPKEDEDSLYELLFRWQVADGSG